MVSSLFNMVGIQMSVPNVSRVKDKHPDLTHHSTVQSYNHTTKNHIHYITTISLLSYRQAIPDASQESNIGFPASGVRKGKCNYEKSLNRNRTFGSSPSRKPSPPCKGERVRRDFNYSSYKKPSASRTNIVRRIAVSPSTDPFIQNQPHVAKFNPSRSFYGKESTSRHAPRYPYI
jgi:hypothetical protein